MMTVLFATRNGARWLDRTLLSMCALQPPAGGYKLIVIDNGSTDNSAEIVRGYADRLPLTVLEESVAGKNRALNRGLGDIEGDLVVFTDDDVIVASDWLLQLRHSAGQRPDFGIFGGPIAPHWPGQQPLWPLRAVNLSTVYTLTGPLHNEGEVPPRFVFGPNMMVRAQYFAQGLRFDESVGPDGSPVYAMGSETALLLELAARGVRAWFTPTATVRHIIRAEQLPASWVVARYYRSGRGKGRQLANDYRGPLLAGAPRYLFAQWARACAAWLLATLSANATDKFRQRLLMAQCRGQIHEFRHQAARRQRREAAP